MLQMIRSPKEKLAAGSAKHTAARKSQKTAILSEFTDSWDLHVYGIGAPTIPRE